MCHRAIYGSIFLQRLERRRAPRIIEKGEHTSKMSEYSDLIIDLARQVWSELGPGYSERVYHNAMEVMLRNAGVRYETERIIPISFRGHVIGNLRADIVVDNRLIVELKAIKTLKEDNKVQAKRYIELTGLPCTLLINFPQPCGDAEFFLVE